MWPGLANVDFQGSASANYFNCVYNDYGGSFLDCLHAVDRNTTSSYVNGKCLSSSWMLHVLPAARQLHAHLDERRHSAHYHSLTIALRRSFSQGFSFDFNYAWSHSIDLGSAAESGAGQQGAAIQNIFNTKEFRGSSDFDMRHNISANFLYELPIGKNKMLFRNAPGWVNQIIGGWQVSSVIRYRTGLPSTVAGDLAYNANYWLNSLAIRHAAGAHRRADRPERYSQHLRQHFRRQLVRRRIAGSQRHARRRPAGALLQHRPDACEIVQAALGRASACNSGRKRSTLSTT